MAGYEITAVKIDIPENWRKLLYLFELPKLIFICMRRKHDGL